MIINPSLFLAFFTAFLVTTIATPIALIFIKKMGLYDDPKSHIHPGIIHKKPIPRGGGIPLFIGASVAGILFLPINQITIAIFAAALLALTIGIVDDRLNARSKDASPYLRFSINILCAVIVVGSGVSMSFITSPFGGILYFDHILPTIFSHLPISLAQILSVLWIVWVMNMLNWSKGVDGQMPGIVIISALTIGFLSLRFPLNDASILTDAVLAFIIAGCMLGFLLYNFHPAKIFPGYGATAIYLLLAIVSILSSSKLATAILVMGIPTVDALFTILRRLVQRKNPFFGDNKHLHHLLLDLGYSQRQIALFYWCISAILGLVSLTLESKSKLFAIIMVGIITGGGLLCLHLMARYSTEKDIS
jgi:UDP-GlcNAc:undecaprenyl-phosphate GlcNAc-1-phosphate transferase